MLPLHDLDVDFVNYLLVQEMVNMSSHTKILIFGADCNLPAKRLKNTRVDLLLSRVLELIAKFPLNISKTL